MSFTLTNSGANIINVDNLSIAPGTSKVVSFVSAAAQLAIAAGALTCVPPLAAVVIPEAADPEAPTDEESAAIALAANVINASAQASSLDQRYS